MCGNSLQQRYNHGREQTEPCHGMNAGQNDYNVKVTVHFHFTAALGAHPIIFNKPCACILITKTCMCTCLHVTVKRELQPLHTCCHWRCVIAIDELLYIHTSILDLFSVVRCLVITLKSYTHCPMAQHSRCFLFVVKCKISPQLFVGYTDLLHTLMAQYSGLGLGLQFR